MLKVTIIAVGSLKEKFWRDACAEYVKRLGAYCKPEIIEIEESKAPDRPNDAQIGAVIEAEGKRIIAKIPKGAAVIPLCIEGQQFGSAAFAARLDKLAVEGVSHVTFVIGGSWGLSPAVKQLGAGMSMSKMTFPHMLARVMLLEQIYRAFQISSGGNYHK